MHKRQVSRIHQANDGLIEIGLENSFDVDVRVSIENGWNGIADFSWAFFPIAEIDPGQSSVVDARQGDGFDSVFDSKLSLGFG